MAVKSRMRDGMLGLNACFLVNNRMSDIPTVRRDERGRLLPGVVLNPHGRPMVDAPRFSRDSLQKVCVEENYEPIRALIALSRRPDASPYLQFAIHKEIAEYLYPKRRAVVIGDEAEGGNTIRIAWDTGPSEPPPRKTVDKAEKQFDSAMTEAHDRIMDAVLSDEDDGT